MERQRRVEQRGSGERDRKGECDSRARDSDDDMREKERSEECDRRAAGNFAEASCVLLDAVHQSPSLSLSFPFHPPSHLSHAKADMLHRSLVQAHKCECLC